MSRSIAAVLLICVPLGALAQSSELDTLRLKAQAEGSVEVTVVTRAATNVGASSAVETSAEQRKALKRDQDKILVGLIARGLVVGNEIFVQPDGSFSMRVLPAGLEQLVRNADVAEVHAVQRNQSGDLR